MPSNEGALSQTSCFLGRGAARCVPTNLVLATEQMKGAGFLLKVAR